MRAIVLIQPREGIYNRFHAWIPLSLVSISSQLFQEGYRIIILDQRLDPSWRKTLRRHLREDPVCVGVTSMTGSQILSALEASQIVKEYGKCPVVWGGVHPTLFPSQTLNDHRIDIVVRGEGERTFYDLVKTLEKGGPLDGISGISFRKDGANIETPDRPFTSMDDIQPKAYEMVDIEEYVHPFYGAERAIEIETSRGCPYNCGFCYNPLYNLRRWRAMSASRVISILKDIQSRFKVRAFHIVDDAFFIDRKRTMQIMEGILREGLKTALIFQGATVRDILRMEPEELSVLERAGCRMLQFGVESGSPRVLKLIGKDTGVEEVLELNGRLRENPGIIPYYNFIIGFPTETREEALMTAHLAWKLLIENPMSLVSPFHHYKQYPGTPLFDLARRNGYATPLSLEEWGAYDWTSAIPREGARSHSRLLKNMEVASIFVDRKIDLVTNSLIYKMAARLYRPMARFRMARSFYSLMPEARAFQWVVS